MDRVRRAASRYWEWARTELSYPPFLVLLGLGVFVRIAVMAMYFPSWMQSLDSVRYSRVIETPTFSDYWAPAGYALFTAGLRQITTELWVTIALQHLIGVLTGIVLYLVMRRLGARAWLACIPAAVAFLSGDMLWIEHQIMTESFATALIAAGLGATVRGLVPRVDLRWLAGGSLLLMYAGLSRNVALVAVPITVACVGFWVQGPLRARLRPLAAATLPALALFGLYVAVFEISGGQYLGLTDMSGWNTYARIAPYADCSKFTPPPGTQRLCETTPTSQREGSLGYEWDETSIGRTEFPLGPDTDGIVGEFAREAILHQPLSYLKAVVTDAARYIDFDIGPERAYNGQPSATQSFGLVDEGTRAFVTEWMSKAYTGTEIHVHGRKILATYQNLFRVGGLLLAAFFVLTLVGMVVARGAFRLGVYLFGLVSLAMYLVPVMTLSYEFRYALPPQLFLIASGTLGFAALLARRYPSAVVEEISGRGSGPAPAAAAP